VTDRRPRQFRDADPSSTADDAEPDAEEDNAPPCVANRVAGMCMPTIRALAEEVVRAPRPRSPAAATSPIRQCSAAPTSRSADGGNLNGQLVRGVWRRRHVRIERQLRARRPHVVARPRRRSRAARRFARRDIQCCADTKGQAIPVSNSCPQYAGLSFPLALGSLKEISVNWGFARSNGRRCHAAVDIYTTGARQVVAVDDGEVVSIMKNWYSCSGGTIDAIFVYHSTGALQGKTINYGEVDPGTYTVRVGSQIKRKGDKLGVASRCDMLHFELYEGRRTQQLVLAAVGRDRLRLRRTSPRTKPAELLDPRDLLRCTMPAACALPQRRLVPRGSDDLSAFDADNDADGDDGFVAGVEGDESLSGGAIAGIAIGLLLFCVLIAGIAYWVVTVRTRDRGNNDLASGNSITMQTDDSFKEAANNLARAAYTQQYTCAQCGNSYSSADDLVQHRQLRH
jgi:hypothetical protein